MHSTLSFDRQLQNVEVKKRRRRGRRPIDYSKPACVYDTYELYNLATDYGLSFGSNNYNYFKFDVDGNHQIRVVSMTIFYKSSGPSGNTAQTPTLAPCWVLIS